MLLYVHRVKYRDYKRALREKEEEERRRQEERLRQEEEERLRREEQERLRREEQERLRREEQERLKQQQEKQGKAEEDARRRTQSMNEEDERRRKLIEQTRNIPIPPPLTAMASLPEIPLSTSLPSTYSSADLDLSDHSGDALASRDSSESADNLQVSSYLLLFQNLPPGRSFHHNSSLHHHLFATLEG